jgi:hypothetical protein
MNDTYRSRALAAAGAVGGLAGGTAMTVLMTQVAARLLPHDLLPDTPAPQKVVQWAQDEVGAPQALTGRPKDVAALVTHFAYSAGSGAIYGLARPALPPLRALPTPAAGVLFGLVFRRLWRGGPFRAENDAWLPADVVAPWFVQAVD